MKIYRVGNDIQFEVTDNGPGMTEERLNEVVSSFHSEPDYEKVEHIGLRNINARLKLKYGDDNGLVIGNVPNSGVSVSFKVRILESM